jgi:serine/threonine protein kinase
MKCEVCQREFHSPYSNLVAVCSQCIARGASSEDAPPQQEQEQVDGTGGQAFDSGQSTGFIGANELTDLFPEFEIGECLGAGGMGVVFRARQKSLDRSVAIKVLNPKLAGDLEFEERFEREARAMAMLNHPNIAGIHDFGVRGPYHFLVMELVDGRDLHQLIQAGCLDPALAFSIIRQVCDALYHAHQNGVVHRDIKPGNILVGSDGVAKISDFGLARILQLGTDVPLTMASAGMGTPAYIAPEQRIDARSSDARSDIFALGVVVYEMLTGSTPAGNFPPPTSRLPRRNRRLDEAILRAMDPDPANRLSDLRVISKLVAESKLPNPVEQERGKTVNRWPVFLTSAFVLALVGAGWIAWSKHDPSTGLPSLGASRAPAPPSLEKLLPKTGLRGTEEFERMRRRGGILRGWSERPGILNIEAAAGIDDLVFVKEGPNIVLTWYAARRNGEMVSSQPGLSSRSDYRRVSHSFIIEWPDRLVPSPPHSTRQYLPLLQPTPRATDLTESFVTDLALIATPEGRLAFAASDLWVKSHRHVIDRLEGLQNVVAVESWGLHYVVLTAEGKAHSWAEHLGYFESPQDARKLVQVAAGAMHVLGLYEDGSVVTWCHPNNRNSRIAPALIVPPDLGPIIRVRSSGLTNAAQRPDGSWFAWGDDEGRGLNDQVNAIGPALDLETYGVNNHSGAKLLWIEPRPSDSGAEKATPPEKVVAPPSLEKLLPKTGLRGTEAFERMRRRGGTLRRWSEKPGMVEIETASGIDDLVYVASAPNIATRWYAARSNGEMISSLPGLGSRRDYWRLSHSFFIEWPDRLVPSSPPSGREFLPLLAPTPRATDLTQSYDVALFVTPEGRLAFGASDAWVKSHRYVLDRLDALENVVAVESWVREFVVLTAEGKAFCWIEPNGFFDPPEDERKLVQVAAGAHHMIGLYEDGAVVTWCHPDSRKHPRVASAMSLPPDLGPIIRVESWDFSNAAQRPDGSWLAWGDDEGRGLIEQINSIGPALDLEAFRVTFSTGAKMIWIEPAPLPAEKADQDSPQSEE